MYSPSYLNESSASSDSEPLGVKWIQQQSQERTVWTELLSDVKNMWYYPVLLSGGKHENSFLCFADTELSCPFVLKILPSSVKSLDVFPVQTTNDSMDPALLEWNIYQVILNEMKQERVLQFPYLYHSFIESLVTVGKRFVFATDEDTNRIRKKFGWKTPRMVTPTSWTNFCKTQKHSKGICLCMEFSMLTSIKSWTYRFREAMLLAREQPQTNKVSTWYTFGIPYYIGKQITQQIKSLKPYYKWSADDDPSWRPHRYYLNPEWRHIFEAPILNVIWKNIFFQVVFALEYMHRLLPGFRHFDLHSGNVLLNPIGDEANLQRPTYMMFQVDDTMFYVPMVGLIAQLFDFDFTQTRHWKNKKITSQEPVLSKRHGIGRETPRAYDYHLFFTSFQCQNHQYDIDTRVFLNDMVPNGYRMNQKYTVGKSAKQANSNKYRMSYKQRHSGEVPEGIRILDHPYFDEYRVKPSQAEMWAYPFVLPESPEDPS